MVWLGVGVFTRFEIDARSEAELERLRSICESVFRGLLVEELLVDGDSVLESEARIAPEGVVSRHHSSRARSRKGRARARRESRHYEPYRSGE